MNPYMVKTTTLYSDGSETVIEYTANPQGDAIETEVAEEMASHSDETPDAESPSDSSSDVSSSDSVQVGETTGTESVTE